jgi:hypothetical protein
VPQQPERDSAQGVRELGWAQFGELAGELAARIGREFRPDVVVGVENGGVFLGGALAPLLGAVFQAVKVRQGIRHPVVESLPPLAGKAVLVVDDITVSGRTLTAASAAVRRAGAQQRRTATLVSRSGADGPDYCALETADLVVFPWDYQVSIPAPGSAEDGE